MTIAAANVKISDIATEIAVGNTNFSLGDRSRRLWKNGPSDYASYKEIRYFGSNCQFSTVLTAQGTFLQNSTDPWAWITANGMNAKPCGMGEWIGYDHEIKSTIGRFRVGTDANSQWNGNSTPEATNPSPLDDVVAHNGAFHHRISASFPAGQTHASTGIALWAEKALGVVYIKLANVAGSAWGPGYAGRHATNVQRLGPDSGASGTAGNGAGQTTTADTQGTTFANTTLMTIPGATRITGCEVTLESGLPTDSSGNQPNDSDYPYTVFSGIAARTIDHDASVTTGATSTTNFGATKIGYDLCVGGSYALYGGHVEAVFGVEFNFYATNNLQSTVDHDDYAVGQLEILDSNPAGPTGTNGVDEDKPFRSHKVTVYVSLFSMGEHTFTG